jgi:hypothetical protein
VALNRLFSIQFIFQAFQLLLVIDRARERERKEQKISLFICSFWGRKKLFLRICHYEAYAQEKAFSRFLLYLLLCVRIESKYELSCHQFVFGIFARERNGTNGASSG